MSKARKVVTTLFCDLVAFTGMSGAVDPRDADRVIGEYFARTTSSHLGPAGSLRQRALPTETPAKRAIPPYIPGEVRSRQ